MIDIEIKSIVKVKFVRPMCYFLASLDVDVGDLVMVDGVINKGESLKALYRVVAAGTFHEHKIDNLTKLGLVCGLQAVMIYGLGEVSAQIVSCKELKNY